MKIKDTEVRIIQGDITGLKVDAIVNAANNKLAMGGGVAGAIKKKGGKIIEEEAVKKGPIEIGGAIETGAGSLSAKYVIHAATMGMDFQTDELKIRSSCANTLKLADKLKISSIVFPALGCGVGGFPLLASAKIMAQEVLRHTREEKTTLKEIIFCLYDKEAYAIFNKGVASYLEYVLHKLGLGPFITVDAIIEIDGGVVLIERSNPPFGLALPGGFVDYNESLEDACIREMKEETGLDLIELKQFHTYSQPGRDPRFHTVATVFTAKGKGKPEAGDDAQALRIVKLEEIEKLNFAFDHKKILKDYLKSRSARGF
ncbi:MAG: macro domain-containing protein [Candidatus Omnitrophota bacterium]|jgi:O-acetyl-ADP-ribose deacetylase (regulator of RNase III)/ADP-ribose pyrophosphatase YjhB (NUDIX family)